MIKLMRFKTICLLSGAILGCSGASAERELTDRDKDAIRAEIEQVMRQAYDLSRPNAAERMLSLYPRTGAVISSNGGRVSASRDSLETSIRYFWNNVGVNMQEPRWEWDRFYVDVLSRDAAVATATYHIPHRNPQGQPHVLGGAMTAVFQQQGGRWVIIQEHLSDLPQLP